MNGELDEARALHRRSRALLRDLGQDVAAATIGMELMRIELCGGDLAIAEREARADYAFLEKIGETYFRAGMAELLVRVVRNQGRDAEALALSHKAEALTDPDDVYGQAFWRSIRAPILARRRLANRRRTCADRRRNAFAERSTQRQGRRNH